MGIKFIKKPSTWIKNFKDYLANEFQKVGRSRTERDKIKDAIMIEQKRYLRRKVGTGMSLKRRSNISKRIVNLRARLDTVKP